MRIGGEGSCWRKAIWFSVDYCAIVPFQKFFSVWMDAFLLIWKRSLLPPNLIPTGNAGATFRESFLARSARARKPGRHHRTWMKRLPDSWWLGEAIGDDPQSWRVEAKANMGGIDLDVFPLAALLLEARPPGDHPVGARVDRR